MSKPKPIYRVSFAPYDPQGAEPLLLEPVEIGAIWKRKNGKAGGILRLKDTSPADLRRGVIFIQPVMNGGAV